MNYNDIDYESILLTEIKTHVGFDRRITHKDITTICIEKGAIGLTERVTRKTFAELVEKGALIIGTPKGGVHWAETKEEIIECRTRLRRKGIKECIRGRRLLRNWNAEQDRIEERQQLSLAGVR